MGQKREQQEKKKSAGQCSREILAIHFWCEDDFSFSLSLSSVRPLPSIIPQWLRHHHVTMKSSFVFYFSFRFSFSFKMYKASEMPSGIQGDPIFATNLLWSCTSFRSKPKVPAAHSTSLLPNSLRPSPALLIILKKRRTKLALLPPVSDSLALSASLVGTGRIVKRELQTKHHQAERERWPGNLLLSDWPLAQW